MFKFVYAWDEMMTMEERNNFFFFDLIQFEKFVWTIMSLWAAEEEKNTRIKHLPQQEWQAAVKMGNINSRLKNVHTLHIHAYKNHTCEMEREEKKKK